MSIHTTSGVQVHSELHRVPAVPGFANHLDVWLYFKDIAQADPDQRLVIDDEHARHCSFSPGR
jgi:hypothetical protein